MSYTYRIHGARYLRKYTASEKSSAYSYMADVRKIANTLCDVPWERVKADIAATTTIHTEEGLDWNVEERNRFDAAEWCAEHSDGYHRAFAQAACYVFKMPTAAIGSNIDKIKVNVTSDPYNPYGARISAMTSDTLTIPTDCSTVRTGEVYRAPDAAGLGAAPRIYVQNTNGSQTWYANNEVVELTPAAALAAKQYLFVFVCLENYNRGRNGWIEGSSYIDNDVELSLSTSCASLDANELNDLSALTSPVDFHVCANGVVADLEGTANGIVSVNVTASGTVPKLDGNGFVEDIDSLSDETSPANNLHGVASAYGLFSSGNAEGADVRYAAPSGRRLGVGFCCKGSVVSLYNANGVRVDQSVVSITASSLMVPFGVPEGFCAIQFDWASWLTRNSPTNGTKFNFWIKRGAFVRQYPADTLKKIAIYDASAKDVDGWEFLKTVSASAGSTGRIDVDLSGVDVATVLVTAFYPMSGVASQSNAFCFGSGDMRYDVLTDENHLPVGGMYAAYDATQNYAAGDRVVTKYLDRAEFIDVNYFINGKYFSFSQDGTNVVISASDNGIDWVDVASLSAVGNILDFCYANGFYHLVHRSASGTTYVKTRRSADLTTWTSPVDIFAYNSGCIHFACGSRLYAIANETSYYVSDDNGDTWTDKTFESPAATSIQSGDVKKDINGRVFLKMYGNMVRMASGGDIVNVTSISNVPACYFKGYYYVIDGNAVKRSLDGITWGTVLTANGADRLVNSRLTICLMCSAAVYVSSDGFTWSLVNESTTGHPDDICNWNECWYLASTVSQVSKVWKTYDFMSFACVVESQTVFDEIDAVNGILLLDESYNTSSMVRMFDGVNLTALNVGRYYVIGNICLSSYYESGSRLLLYRLMGDMAIEATESNAANITSAKWRVLDVDAKCRLTGHSSLCVPDIKLIG